MAVHSNVRLSVDKNIAVVHISRFEKSMKKSLTAFSNKELSLIHSKSRLYNRRIKKDHTQALLEMISHHADEINELYKKGNKHCVVETGDLIVLCLELIKEAKQSPDAVLNKCYPRFQTKLSKLLTKK